MAVVGGHSSTALAATVKPGSDRAASGSATTSKPPAAAPKAVAPKRDPKALRATAAAELAEADLADDCSGALAPHTVYSCAGEQTGDYTFTLTSSHDLVVVQVVSSEWTFGLPALTAPDGSAVTCARRDGDGSGEVRCPTDQPGTYTLRANGVGGFTVSYLALLSGDSCTAVTAADTSLGAPASFTRSLPTGSSGDCYTLPSATGDVLRSHVSAWQVAETVYDATGAEVCSTVDSGESDYDCALKGVAPFRVLARQLYGAAVDYTATLSRLSRPDGCPVVTPQAFGAVPDSSSSARCRILRVTTRAPYVYGVVGESVYGSLYSATGSPACALVATCELPAGDYTWARAGRDTAPTAFGLWFYATNQTDGCTAVRDDGFVSGPTTGTLSGAGQRVCMVLPTPAGRGIHLIPGSASGGVQVSGPIYDATGVQQPCDPNGAPVCRLTGTAPFHAVLSNSHSATGTYGYAYHRTDNTAGCTSWPQSAFGGSWGVQVALTADTQRVCLGLPADKHSTAEMIDYTNTLNQVNASVRVFDGAGNQVCSTVGGSTTTCRYTAGAAYTALLMGTGRTDTYKLVRRDVSPTAACAKPATTAVGGRSTGYTFTSALDSTCLRVTAAATDKFWFTARTPTAAYRTGTQMGVVDASGRVVCMTLAGSTAPCRATGSTSYTVFALAAGYSGVPIAVRFDTWKVGTSSGWVPECTAHPVSVEGFVPRSGTFTESATGYCAVMQLKPSQRFSLHGTYSSGNSSGPWATLLGANGFNGTGFVSDYQCVQYAGQFRVGCSTYSTAVAGQYVLVVSPGSAAAPLEYTFQGVCEQGCAKPPVQPDVTSVSPAGGPAGTANQVVVRGTGLHLGTSVRLVDGDIESGAGTAEPVSASADGTRLTVLLSTRDVAPGAYGIAVGDGGYTSGTRSPGYLPNAYTVTAAPAATSSRFVPLTPKRFLDTRYGTGAPKARVGAGGVVKLKVAGVNGVPSTGVTAVVMNVTVAAPSTSGRITVYPDGKPLPGTSDVSFRTGKTISNLVTVAVRNGVVDLRNSAGTVDLIADVSGYYKSGTSGSALTAVTPMRLLDTRNGTGAPKARVGAGGVVKLKVAGVRGIPATGVTAVMVNLTAVGPSTNGYLTAYPDGITAPTTRSLNYTTGTTLRNLAVVRVVNGTIDVRNSAGTVDILGDVTGYFTASGSAYTALDPVRTLSTGIGFGARTGVVGPGGTVSTRVAGVNGIPASGVTAVVLNVTAASPTADSWMTVWPHGKSLSGSLAALNYPSGSTITNEVVVPVVDGRISFINQVGDVQVIADVSGYFSS
ncbi:hypothetical protein ACFQLX_11125 [Streptomyces polyrhachis]|uniref:IPT/TIG domain-containing protein n=1 Tax=Streptomyces polyrhachis TaxID=1282885 RepID=A0ABW2GH51_9ACTN